MALRRAIPGVELREFIHAYEDAPLRIPALPSGRSLCGYGGQKNCRCRRCKGPVHCKGDDPILCKIALKTGRFHRGRQRNKAARWVYLLSGIVSLRRGHGILEGMLLAVSCGRGAHAHFLNRCKHVLFAEVNVLASRWLAALFLQYVEDRSDVRGLTGTAATAFTFIEFPCG